MADTNLNDFPFYRYNPWHEAANIRCLWENAPLPPECFFPTDLIPQRNPDKYFDFLLDLTWEAQSALREILGILVEFRQRDKLMQFLFFFCDSLEFTLDKTTDSLSECKFQVDFSDGVSVLFSTRLCGCIVTMEGRRHCFHEIALVALDELRQLLDEIWAQSRSFPIWEITEGNDHTVTYHWSPNR